MPYSLISLPDHALLTILFYLTYDEIAICRNVCKRLDYVCGHLLTWGFYSAKPFFNVVQERINKKMPRKISDRSNSIYFNHQIILCHIDLILRRLHAVYAEYMEDGRCYFIPGKIIGKIYSTLLYLAKCNTTPKVSMAELENLTVMAIEHFQEHILPVIKYRKRLGLGQRVFSADNVCPFFSAVEQPKFLFPTDEQSVTAYSERRDCANENSGGGDSSADCTGNDASSHENAANKGSRPAHKDLVSSYSGEHSAGKCTGPELNLPAFPAPGCSWMNEPKPRPKVNYSAQGIVNDVQYLKSCICYQSLQISAQEIKLRKQTSLIAEQRKKIFKMEVALAESNHKFTQLEKKFEMLYNNYTKLSHTSGTITTSNAFVPGSTNLVEGNCDNETISCSINETSRVSEMPGQSKITSAEVHKKEHVKMTFLKINEKLKEKIEEKAGPSQMIHAKSAFPSKRGVKRMRTPEESDESLSE